MKKRILIGILIAAATVANAQSSDSRDAAAVPDALFAAMRTRSFADIRAQFTPDGQLVAIDRPREGDGFPKMRVFTADGFAKTISESKSAEYIEKMPSKDVRVAGDLAVVTGRYSFFVGEKFSHCGTNTFNLVRTAAGWKIANAASTLEFQCERDLRSVDVPEIAADPNDVGSIDAIVKAFYATISGPKGTPRQWSRDRTLYTRDVRFVALSERDGKPRANIQSHAEYVNGSNGFFVAEGFTEREINRVERRFGNLAHVFSTYEFAASDGKVKGRGVNSIELFWDGARWWISAVTWDEERPGNPIPKEFLPRRKK